MLEVLSLTITRGDVSVPQGGEEGGAAASQDLTLKVSNMITAAKEFELIQFFQYYDVSVVRARLFRDPITSKSRGCVCVCVLWSESSFLEQRHGTFGMRRNRSPFLYKKPSAWFSLCLLTLVR